MVLSPETCPFAFDIFKMLEHYSFDFSLVLPGHPIAKRLIHIKVLSVEPIFTFFFSLSAMNVNWFICLVSVEKEKKRHPRISSIVGKECVPPRSLSNHPIALANRLGGMA
jgi:hypothetical protein